MEFEVTPEEEEALIERIAQEVHKRRVEDLAGIVLETAKPLSFIGTQMGRFFLSPFLPILGDSLESESEKVLHVFEKRTNVERLLNRIEELQREEKVREAERKEEERRLQLERGEEPDVGGLRGWWKWLTGDRRKGN